MIIMKAYKAIWLKNHVINFMTYYTKVGHDIDHVIISQYGRQFELNFGLNGSFTA